MRTVHSHSSLSSFENCPKQYEFRYVLKIPAESESIEAYLGKRVHEVLERLYRVVREGRVPSLAQVIRRFRENWEGRFDAGRVRIARAENEAGFYRSLGERCLTNHYRAHYPFDGEETLGLEEPVQFPLDDGGSFRIRGIIDRLVRARDGGIEIHDFKTGQRVPPQRALDQDRQLALYQLGVASRFGPDTPVRLVWHYLLHGIVRSSTRSAEQLDELRRRTIELIQRIHADEEFTPKPGPLCDWCEYRERCPAAPRTAGSEATSSEPAAATLDAAAPALVPPRGRVPAAPGTPRALGAAGLDAAPPAATPGASAGAQLRLFEA